MNSSSLFQIMLVTYDDETLNLIQTKANRLRDDLDLDLDVRLQLWKETLHLRRKAIRSRTALEIIEEFPGYNDPLLVNLFLIFYICIEYIYFYNRFLKK